MAQSSTLSGLALPSIRQLGGYFPARTKYDAAWGDLLLAILTPIGTRPGLREFGSALHLAIGSLSIVGGDQTISRTIRTAAARWCPHVYIDQIYMSAAVSDLSVLKLGVLFGLTDEAGSVERQTVLGFDAQTKTLRNL